MTLSFAIVGDFEVTYTEVFNVFFCENRLTFEVKDSYKCSRGKEFQQAFNESAIPFMKTFSNVSYIKIA